MNKRGWLRIVEALVAILIVFGAVLTVSTTKQTTTANDPCVALAPLLDEIAATPALRNEILSGKTAETERFLKNNIRNPKLDVVVKVCAHDAVLCPHGRDGSDKADICAQERLIAGSAESTALKKLKVFVFQAD